MHVCAGTHAHLRQDSRPLILVCLIVLAWLSPGSTLSLHTIRTALGSPGRLANLVRFQSASLLCKYACVHVRVYIVYLRVSRTVPALELSQADSRVLQLR